MERLGKVIAGTPDNFFYNAEREQRYGYREPKEGRRGRRLRLKVGERPRIG